MMIKELRYFFLVIWFANSIAAASQQDYEELFKAIENLDKIRVQQLLLYIDYSPQELSDAYAQALAVYNQKNRFFARINERLGVPLQTAGLLTAIMSALCAMELFWQERYCQENYKLRAEQHLRDIQLLKNQIIAIEQRPKRQMSKEISLPERLWLPFDNCWRYINLPTQRAILTQAIANKESEQAFDASILAVQSHSCQNRIKIWLGFGLVGGAVFYFLAREGKVLKDARIIVAAIDAKIRQVNRLKNA